MAEAASSPTAPTPVMDVVAPPIDKKPEAPAAQADPLDKLVADDQREQQTTATHHVDKHDKSAKHPQSAAPARHNEQTHGGVGAAITATVVIVLALAALATYAYIQTNK
jgi:hypothetical protein